MHKGFRLAALITLFLGFNFPLFSTAHAAEKPGSQARLSQIKQLMSAHKAQEAYQLAIEMAHQEEGRLDFDLLFGAVAIDANHPDVAIFALDRVLMQQPGNLYAKQKLGQAYYLLGDYPSAKRLLKTVIASQAPEALRSEAKKILEQTKKPPKNPGQAKSNTFSFEVEGGYDSNINSATTSTSISVPTSFTPLQLSEENLATHDQIANFTGDWQGYYPIPNSSEAGLFWDINDSYRDNIHNAALNLNTFSTMSGLMLQKGNYTLRVPLRTQLMYLSGDPLRRALAMAINVTRLINPRHAAMLFVEKGTQTYPFQEPSDSSSGEDQPTPPLRNPLSAATNLAGGGWFYTLDNKTQVVTRAYYGINRGCLDFYPSASKTDRFYARLSNSFSSHYYGAQLSLTRQISDKSSASIDLGQQFATYNIIDAVFEVLRKDNFLNLGLSYQWKYNQNIILMGNYIHYENDSNLPLFQYRRNIVDLGLRYTL